MDHRRRGTGTSRLYLEHLRNRIVGLEGSLTEQHRVHAYYGGTDGRIYALDILRNDIAPIPDDRVRIPLDVAKGSLLDIRPERNMKSGGYRVRVQSGGTGFLNVLTIGVDQR